jgi:site-specific DNA-methyltransferase (adenine-specific)
MNYVNKIFNEDCIIGASNIPDNSIDLLIADPPYCLGKDYGNNSDKLSAKEYLDWTFHWIETYIPKLKETGSFYIFLSWQYSPEIFSFLKTKLTMVNEIIWDRKVPSMGGSTRKFSSVHDNIGFFVKNLKTYHFDIDAIRIPYDAETKKARSRSIFVGKKWLEMGYNPKDIWSIARIHAQDPERENHPTQKPLDVIDRIIRASSKENDLILDPFLGTGTSIISAINNKRNFTGFELNPEYYSNILKRIEKNIDLLTAV